MAIKVRPAPSINRFALISASRIILKRPGANLMIYCILEIIEFGIKQVEKAQISTVKR